MRLQLQWMQSCTQPLLEFGPIRCKPKFSALDLGFTETGGILVKRSSEDVDFVSILLYGLITRCFIYCQQSMIYISHDLAWSLNLNTDQTPRIVAFNSDIIKFLHNYHTVRESSIFWYFTQVWKSMRTPKVATHTSESVFGGCCSNCMILSQEQRPHQISLQMKW